MDRSRRNMLLPTCKDCHNYRRKRSYYTALESLKRPINESSRRAALSYIFPLNAQNRHVLSMILNTPNPPVNVRLSAEHVKTKSKVIVDLTHKRESGGKMTVTTDDSWVTYDCNGHGVESFLETAVKILHDLRVRLD